MPSESTHPGAAADKPSFDLIQGLKEGLINPETLTKEQRQLCTETLFLEGYSPPQIAQLVGRSEKTVRRDLIDIRARNALNPSPEVAKQLVGNFLMKVEMHQSRLMRLARGNDGSVGDRAAAEFSAWRVLKESLELLQSLGFLPLRPQQIMGDVVHHLSTDESDPPLDDIDKTIQEITAIGEVTHTLTPEIVKRISILQERLEKARLSEDAKKLFDDQQKLSQEKELSDDENTIK